MADTTEGKGQDVSTAVNIAADGDVILVVGPEKSKIRVYSFMLKAASKPFSAMLGPSWKEGRQQHTADVPNELQLPDDDAVGMKYICAVLHHQSQMIPAALHVNVVLSIAVLADKYDFVNALAFASAAWLVPAGKEASDLMVLAAAAVLLLNAKLFTAITKSLILNYGGSYLHLFNQDLESTLSWRVVCKSYKPVCHRKLLTE